MISLSSNLGSVKANMLRRAKRLDDLPDKIADELAKRGETYAKQRSPVKTGKLRGSIQVRKMGRGMRDIYTPTKYAPYVEYGTRPHLIIPKHFDGYLYWKGAEHPVRFVNHPGTRAKPFFKPTSEYLKTITPAVTMTEARKALR